MPARILVGSCSWTDPTLIACGRFYPPGVTSAEARLRYYAEQFGIVEVDSTYYAPPSARNSELWAARTPARLRVQHQGVRAADPPPRGRWNVCPTGCATRCLRRHAANATPTRRTSPRRSSTRSGSSTARRSSRSPPPASSARCCSSSRPGSCAPARTASTCAGCRTACPAGRWRSSSAAAAGWTTDPPPDSLRLLEDAGLDLRGGRRTAGVRQQHSPAGRGDGSAGDGPPPRTQRRHVGEPDRRGIRPLQVPVRRRRARGVGPARARARHPDASVHVLFNNNYEDWGMQNARRMAHLLGVETQPPQAQLELG